MERELTELRARVSEQQRLLQGTAERLRTANQQRENLEQFIVSQCRCPCAGTGAKCWGSRLLLHQPLLCCQRAVRREAQGSGSAGGEAGWGVPGPPVPAGAGGHGGERGEGLEGQAPGDQEDMLRKPTTCKVSNFCSPGLSLFQ